MSVVVACECGKRFRVKEENIGKKAKCTGCGQVIVLKAAEETPQLMPDQSSMADAPALPPPAPPLPPMGAPLPPMAPPMTGGGGGPVAPAGNARQKSCPHCGSIISAFALKCEFCGGVVDNRLQYASPQPAKRSGGSNVFTASSDDDLNAAEWVLAILCSGIGCIVGIVWICQGKPKGTKMLITSIIAAVAWNVIRFMLGGLR